jgi:DNA-binding transcriptional MerR regulator
MKFMDIGEVAQQSGVRPSALRYYEELGLISAAARRGLRRQFPETVLLQLNLVALGKLAGFTLREIAPMFGADGNPDVPRGRLREKAEEIDRQLRQLRALRDTLRHVADCRAPSHLECPTFRRLVAAAGRRGSRRAKRSTGMRA